MPLETTVQSRRGTSKRVRRLGWPVLAAVVLALVVPLAGRGSSGAPPPADLASTAKEIDRLFARWNTTDLPGCTLGVSRDGEQIVSRAYGMADLEHSLANRPDTIIEAGSVSKQFTAAAVLLLAQEGKLSLDDSVRKFIPELPDYGKPITVRELLTHTSGLRDWSFVEDVAGWPRTTRVYTHDHVVDIVSRQKALNYPPGTDFSYTNTGYNLAAILVSRVTGKSFADYTREALFEPLGMTRTSWRDDYTRIVRDRAIAYTVSESGVNMNMPFENIHGNGGLLTTVGDLLKWHENMVHGRVGGRAFVDTQLTKGRLANGEEIVYSLGAMYITKWRGIPEVSHSGGTAGYRSWLARYPTERLSVAVLCNASDAPAWVLGRQVADLFLGVKAAPPASPAPVSEAALEGIQGLYCNRRTHEALSIDFVDKQLRVAGMGHLIPLSADTLQAATGSARLEIVRDAAGTVRGTRALVSDEVRDFDRVERARPSPANLEALVGTYTSDEAEVSLVVAIEAGRLVIRRRPNTTIPLTPTYADGFAGSIGHVRFLRDATGKVTHLSIGRDRLWDLRFAKVPQPPVKMRNQP